jgi:hypothetical protein
MGSWSGEDGLGLELRDLVPAYEQVGDEVPEEPR